MDYPLIDLLLTGLLVAGAFGWVAGRSFRALRAAVLARNGHANSKGCASCDSCGACDGK